MNDLFGCSRQRWILPRSLAARLWWKLFLNCCPSLLSWKTDRMRLHALCKASWHPYEKWTEREVIWQETDRNYPSSPGFKVSSGPVITVREHVLSVSLFITAYSRQAEARQSNIVCSSTHTHTHDSQKNKVRDIKRERYIGNMQNKCRQGKKRKG